MVDLLWRKVYGVPGLRLEVRTNSRNFSRDFGRVYRHLEAEGDAQVVYSVVVGREGYVLSMGEEVLYETGEYEELVPALERLAEARMVRALWDRPVFHAGVVAKDDIGVILPAEPGGGKTSLVTALLELGFEYLSDEFAILDLESMTVLPFPKALCFKEEGMELFPHLKSRSLRVEWDMGGRMGRIWYLDPSDSGFKVSGKVRRVDYVVFPERDGTEGAEVISKAKAALKLAENLLNFESFGRDVLDVVLKVVNRAECLRLRTGSPQDGAQVINDLLEGG
ncbi:MAG TPA: hypothetical protein EYP61_08455 [Candidatus Latescibacteria bacterium]|nr:hypothetical protein [Candidatus Latescibacterota bacterium]